MTIFLTISKHFDFTHICRKSKALVHKNNYLQCSLSVLINSHIFLYVLEIFWHSLHKISNYIKRFNQVLLRSLVHIIICQKQPACLEKLPHRPQQQGLGAAPMFHLPATSEVPPYLSHIIGQKVCLQVLNIGF